MPFGTAYVTRVARRRPICQKGSWDRALQTVLLRPFWTLARPERPHRTFWVPTGAIYLSGILGSTRGEEQIKADRQIFFSHSPTMGPSKRVGFELPQALTPLPYLTRRCPAFPPFLPLAEHVRSGLAMLALGLHCAKLDQPMWHARHFRSIRSRENRRHRADGWARHRRPPSHRGPHTQHCPCLPSLSSTWGLVEP